jgi:hypothetical protein
MARFVLLYHSFPGGYPRPSHWDFMLEAGETLRTWALCELPRSWSLAQLRTSELHSDCPAVATVDEVPAVRLGDHRPIYLDYEGPISGDRGHVTRIDSGQYETELESLTLWRVELAGRILRGAIVLEQASSIDANWTLRCA